MDNLASLILQKEEGYREAPYYCSEGYPTIGFGLKIGTKDAPLKQYTFTMPKEIAAKWLDVRSRQLYLELAKDPEIASPWRMCNEVREAVLVSMAYQLGLSGLRRFRKTLNHIERGEWTDAANECLMSRWADQTPERAERHSDLFESGDIDEFREMYGR